MKKLSKLTPLLLLPVLLGACADNSAMLQEPEASPSSTFPLPSSGQTSPPATVNPPESINPDTSIPFRALTETLESDLNLAPNSTITSAVVSDKGDFTRITLDVEGPVPGYYAYQTDTPAMDGSGDLIPFTGSTSLYVSIAGLANGTSEGLDDQNRTYFAGDIPTAGKITSARVTGAFEGQGTLLLGLTDVSQYRVFTLQNPTQLIVDVS